MNTNINTKVTVFFALFILKFVPELEYAHAFLRLDSRNRQMTLGIKLISCQGRPSWIDIIYYMLNSWSSCWMRVQHI